MLTLNTVNDILKVVMILICTWNNKYTLNSIITISM